LPFKDFEIQTTMSNMFMTTIFPNAGSQIRDFVPANYRPRAVTAQHFSGNPHA